MYNIICLKHGKKYNSNYVNVLFNMVKRHTTLPFNFFCFTEDTNGIDSEISVIDLPTKINLSGWWWKPYIFKKDHFDHHTINLFLDLDMVIINNIDKLLSYDCESLVGLKDVSRVFNRYPDKLGSAVLKWPAGSYSHIWDDFKTDMSIMKRFRGDQDYIWFYNKDSIQFFPDAWIRSYKWEVRNQSELLKTNFGFNFKDVRNPVVEKEVAILAFHGSPDPHEVMDPIIVDNWK